jgi:phosphopantetheinyl transferase (holo-ACP synthase)
LISTGNDIVALQATQPEKTNLPRFYSRILTIDEKKLYNRLACPPLAFDQYTWLCWSIKESAYKFNKRNSPELVFSPLRITISELLPPAALPPDRQRPPALGGSTTAGSTASADGYYRCRVSCGQAMLYSRSLLRDGIIATVVSDDPHFTNTRWGFQPIGSSAHADQSAAVRALVLQELQATLHRDDLHLQKDEAGCPIVLAGGQPTGIPVSLSHHDHYIAWSVNYSH